MIEGKVKLFIFKRLLDSLLHILNGIFSSLGTLESRVLRALIRIRLFRRGTFWHAISYFKTAFFYGLNLYIRLIRLKHIFVTRSGDHNFRKFAMLCFFDLDDFLTLFAFTPIDVWIWEVFVWLQYCFWEISVHWSHVSYSKNLLQIHHRLFSFI